jgi:hypothetical protein
VSVLARAILANRVFRYLGGTAVLALAASMVAYAWPVSFGSNASPMWLQFAFAIAWGTFLLTSAASLILSIGIMVKHTSPGESPGRAAVIEIFRRLLIGVCAPTAMLIVLLTLTFAAARGGGEQVRYFAMFVFWGSLVGVPSVGLANCWVLFRAWPRSWRLFGAGMLLPIAYGVLAFVAVHGPKPLDSFFMGVLIPFQLILGLLAPPSRIQVASLAALIALFIVMGIAAWREWRRLDSARSRVQ